MKAHLAHGVLYHGTHMGCDTPWPAVTKARRTPPSPIDLPPIPPSFCSSLFFKCFVYHVQLYLSHIGCDLPNSIIAARNCVNVCFVVPSLFSALWVHVFGLAVAENPFWSKIVFFCWLLFLQVWREVLVETLVSRAKIVCRLWFFWFFSFWEILVSVGFGDFFSFICACLVPACMRVCGCDSVCRYIGAFVCVYICIEGSATWVPQER